MQLLLNLRFPLPDELLEEIDAWMHFDFKVIDQIFYCELLGNGHG